MLFNSFEYLLFLPTTFILYWFIFNKSLLRQNTLLLISSYVFYGWWDWRFLSLIALSTIVDYYVGMHLYNVKNQYKKKLYLLVSILFNLSLLGFFKYYNFFIDSWIDLISGFGFQSKNTWTLNVILPVGISFYTFQTMSYSLDIYYNKLKPTKDFISFASFVSFFPQLVAGPIERASNLLPQILSKRKFSYEQAAQGSRLILWGLFKKIVIADSLANHVDPIFQNYSEYNGGILLLGLIYFSFQIYCDFSGYSDIAIGTAKLFGIELMSNFKFPYFSRNIGEFWRSWHISLSTWFRDYLYIPLGGSKIDDRVALRNIFITFIISGLWHGANWTFVIWGLIHSLLYLPLFLFGSKNYATDKVWEGRSIPSIIDIFKILLTFSAVMIAWAFFRSASINDAFNYLQLMITNFEIPNQNRSGLIFVFISIIFDLFIKKDERDVIRGNSKIVNNLIVFILGVIIILFIEPSINNSFIYFQF